MKDISLHIMDIVQNSISAGASLIELLINSNSNKLKITISDNGKGMTKEMVKTVTDPYTTSRTTRKVGLGIPLFKQNAERSGGMFYIQSELGKGTNVEAIFNTDNIDCLPKGDIIGVFILLLASNPDIEFKLHYSTDKGTYVFDTSEIKQELEGVSITEVEILRFLKDMIKENISIIENN